MNNIYFGKNVVITGHTGFKGSWLTTWLKMLGANVIGIALDPYTDPSNFTVCHLADKIADHRVNISNFNEIQKIIKDSNPDFLFHLAAQAIVKKSYENPLETWETNTIGTLNVLEGLRKLDKKCIAVIITSDKCYNNVEWTWGYRENDTLGGSDPYSASKGSAELVVKSHVQSFFPKETTLVRIASARAGNVIGGGDWSPDRIVPDCVKAWSLSETVKLRNPNATRPWQHVLEPLSGYLSLAAEMLNNKELHGEAFNFGPQLQKDKSVLELVKAIKQNWKDINFEDISDFYNGPYESKLLKLNCDKALNLLNWHAILDFGDTVSYTAEWYKTYYDSKSNMFSFTTKQIKDYTLKAKSKRMKWSQYF
ncbi:MAG: CDP-glucose 4,6-dehydratase [Flavobacteriaceae bacterium]